MVKETYSQNSEVIMAITRKVFDGLQEAITSVKSWVTSGYATKSHKHSSSDITDLQSALNGGLGIAPDWSRTKQFTQMNSYFDSTDTFWSPVVYKINVPGYFRFDTRRLRVDTDIDILLGPTKASMDLFPTNPEGYKNSIMCFYSRHQGDDWGDSAWTSPLIVPGTSTYCRIWCGSNGERATSNVRMSFVPCKLVPTGSNVVLFTAYTATNGTDNDRYNQSQQYVTYPQNCGAIFAGNWEDNI